MQNPFALPLRKAASAPLTAVDVLSSLGHVATAARGAPAGFNHLVTLEHEGVPYSVNLNAEDDSLAPEEAPGALSRRADLIERHHALVRAVYLHLDTRTAADIWVMCGGGSQPQVFFGDTLGYQGILYLDEAGALSRERPYPLLVQSVRSNPLFEGFSHPGINIVQAQP